MGQVYLSSKLSIKYGLIALIIPLAFRAYLEYLSGPFPIGWDTVASYDVWLRTGSQVLSQNRIFFLALWGINSLVNEPTMTVKIIMIFLTGLMSFSIFSWMVSIHQDPKISALAAILTCLYFPVLRISWDLGDNMLALSLGLFALVLFSHNGSKYSYLSALSLTIGSILVDPIVSPIILAVVIFGSKLPAAKKFFTVVVACISIALTLGSPELIRQTVGLEISTSISLYLGINAPIFFAYLFAPVVLFFILAIWKHPVLNKQLIVWSIVTVLVSPFLTLGYRFILLSFIALIPLIVLNIAKMPHRVTLLALLTITIVLFGISYISYSPQNPLGNYYDYPQFNNLIPSSLVANTISIPDSHAAIQLLQTKALENCGKTVLITPTQFFDYALRSNVPLCAIDYIGSNYTAISSLAYSLDTNGKTTYLIWFLDGSRSIPNFTNSFLLLNSSAGVGLYAARWN